MNKVERRVRDLNKQLGLMDVSNDELERMASSVSFFDEKYRHTGGASKLRGNN